MCNESSMATPSGPCGNVAVGTQIGGEPCTPNVKSSTPTACKSMELDATPPTATSRAKSCATVSMEALVMSRRTSAPGDEPNPCPRIFNVTGFPSCTAWGMQELMALVGSQVVTCALPSAGCELGTAELAVAVATCRDCT